MTQKVSKSPATEHSDRKLGVGWLLIDTFWRIAVPVLLFAGGGLFIDAHLHHGPWFTLLGTLIGFVLAAFLVKLEIDTVNRRDS